jgi:hypothetical protein
MGFISDYLRNLSIEDVLRWTRQVFQFLAGSGFGLGVLTGDKWVALGAAVGGVMTFLWQLKANTIANRVVEVKKSPDVVSVKPTADAPAAVKEAAAS